MRISKLFKSIALASTLLPLSTFAAPDKQITLDIGDKQYRGENTLQLKRLVKAYYPKVNLNNFELESVRLVAKSKRGNGTAKLVVGNRSTQAKTIAGIPSEFSENRGYTYDRMTFMNPKNNSNGKWQLDLKGNIKVRKIKLNLERVRSNRPNPPRTDRPSASCTVVLETLWGQDLFDFTDHARGRNMTIAKDKACKRALNSCEESKESFGDLGKFGMCTVKY